MVRIKYYRDPSDEVTTECECDSLLQFLITNFSTRDELLDLRFFHGEILGEEIPQHDLSFLDISDGCVAVTHDSAIPRTPDLWVYAVIAVVMAVATVLLVPKVNIPGASNNQQSATNKLGESNNEPRIGERIDDILGCVSKHVPPLWQVPYRIGVNNQECEVLLLCIGRGRYETYPERWFDGDTRVLDIPGAKISKYEPGTWPGNGSPSFQIGSDINEKVGIYRQSNDLNPTELLPPNDLETTGIVWKLTGSGASGIITPTSLPDGFLLVEHYAVGQELILSGMNYFEPDGTQTLYRPPSVSIDVTKLLSPVDIGVSGTLGYIVTDVTDTTITVTIPVSAPTDVVSAWAAMVDYTPLQSTYHVVSSEVDFYSTGTNLISDTWYSNGAYSSVCTVTQEHYTPSIGESFLGTVGPFTLPSGTNEIILNFVSASGFYKLVSNNETSITANIDVKIEETDEDGVPTGVSIIVPVEYTSNPSVRKSVFKTLRTVVPYQYSRVSAIRTTNRDKSGSVSNVDIIEWRDLYTVEDVSGYDLGNVTLAHVVIPSNSQSRLVKERKQNMDVTRLITQYLGNGEFGPVDSYPTDNFAQLLVYASLDPYIGRLTLDNINADGFLSVSDQIINYFNSDQMVRFGYDFDDSNLTYQDTYTKICNVVNCKPYVQNGVYDFFFERKQDISSMQITCRNKIPDTETREIIFEEKYDGVEVTWRDEITATTETIYLPADGSAVNPNRVELQGCLTYEQAYKFAYRLYNKQVHSRYLISFDVDEFGRNIIPGKRIDSPDSTRFVNRPGVEDGYRIFDGEVVEVRGLNVELSEPVTFTDGEDHYIVFTKENGDNTDPILCTRVDDFTVLLSGLPSEDIYDGYNRDRTKFVFVSEQLRESMALIPQTIEFKMDTDGKETNTVGAIAYSHKYFKNDLDVV